jgi:hypothetical protein
MNWGITTYAATTPGAGYGTSSFVGLTAVGPAPPTPAAAITNPDMGIKLVRVRNANIWVPTNSGAGLAVGGQIVDGGVYTGVPIPIYLIATIPTTVGALGITLGGFTDTSFIQPA